MIKYIVTLFDVYDNLSYYLVSADNSYAALELLKMAYGEIGIYRIRMLPMDEVVWIGGGK